MAKREYSEEIKAAVLAALMEGQSVNGVSKKYNIPKGTVSAWQKRNQDVLEPVREDAARQLNGEGATTELGGLFATYLTTSLTALIAIANLLSDRSYLQDKGIEGVAMAYGVMTDKVVRVTEAMNRAGTESETAEN